jgi:hypothetical protein
MQWLRRIVRVTVLLLKITLEGGERICDAA